MLTVVKCALCLLFLKRPGVVPERSYFCRMRVGQARHVRFVGYPQTCELRLQG